MKAAIHNPYLDTLGGGERYTISFAKVLLDLGWDVEIEWKDSDIKEKLQKRFGINLENSKIVGDIKRGDGYDLCFWVSDGSIPALKSRKNILHFQVPFRDVDGRSLLNKMKLFRVNKIVCNSKFTKAVIDKEYGAESVVIYPSVDTVHIKPKRKENIILFVGRFSQLKQSKNQEVLIKAFKKFVDGMNKDWKLILAGGSEIGATEYLKNLEKISQGYSVEIIKSPDFSALKDLYGKARIFWSASGFGEDETKSPEKVEHFGITVVEAMAAGAVPIVYAAGGHKEIIVDGINGFLWHNTQELARKTNEVINNKSRFVRDAISSSKKYSYDEFRKNITKIL